MFACASISISTRDEDQGTNQEGVVFTLEACQTLVWVVQGGLPVGRPIANAGDQLRPLEPCQRLQ